MSRPFARILTIAAMSGALALTLVGCVQMVRVETGEMVTCTYGEVVTDTVHAIEVPADQAANYSVVKTTITCDRHKQLEELYSQAQAAIVSANLELAKERLAEVVALDSAFKRARTQLDAIDAGQKPIPDTGTDGNTGGSDGQVPVGPVASLAAYVPEALSGYTAQPVVADVYSLTREYIPAAGGVTDYMVIVVEQYKDAASAKAAITNTVALGNGSDVSNVNVAGHDLRFGTDGKRFATLAWTQDGILVVIEASSRARKPAELKSALVAIAGGIVK
jgi:hypothetical protein